MYIDGYDFNDDYFNAWIYDLSYCSELEFDAWNCYGV